LTILLQLQKAVLVCISKGIHEEWHLDEKHPAPCFLSKRTAKRRQGFEASAVSPTPRPNIVGENYY